MKDNQLTPQPRQFARQREQLELISEVFLLIYSRYSFSLFNKMWLILDLGASIELYRSLLYTNTVKVRIQSKDNLILAAPT